MQTYNNNYKQQPILFSVDDVKKVLRSYEPKCGCCNTNEPYKNIQCEKEHMV
jgi:hypothetical protein